MQVPTMAGYETRGAIGVALSLLHNRLTAMPALLEILLTELIQPILCQLDNKRDLTTAALVC